MHRRHMGPERFFFRAPRLFALVAVLAGCGGGEVRSFLVAVDPSPLNSLPATCFRGGTVPVPRVEERNLYRDLRWLLWEGREGRDFLEVDGQGGVWPLGDAPSVVLDGAIAGDGELFSAERELLDGAGTSVARTSARIAFEDTGTLAFGTVGLKSTCASCAGGSALTCETQLPFVAREVPFED